MTFDLNDYVEVSERIRVWYERYPDGRIETEIVAMTDDQVTVRAEVYRAGEVNPAGTGHSFLAIPGATPYTKGSELENAETSAVGRALVMAGVPSKAVASTQEVASKRGGGAGAPTTRDPSGPTPTTDTITPGGSGGHPSGACRHPSTSPLKPDGTEMPEGYERCLDCGKRVKV